jgi:hypothetical protein
MSAPPAAPAAAPVDPSRSRRASIRPRDVLLHPVNLVPFAVYRSPARGEIRRRTVEAVDEQL